MYTVKGDIIVEACMSSMLGNQPVDLSKGLQQLKGEHTPLRDNLEELLTLCKLLESQEEKHKSFLRLTNEVSLFFQRLEEHSLKEEEVLFPMMGVYLGNSGGPIAVMEYEHEQAKGFIRSFLEKSSEAKEEELVIHSQLVKNTYSVLMDHFAKEEAVLFPMAENLFSEEEKQELFNKIQK